MPKFKINMISRAADWDASVTVNAESRDQAERLALKCMANPSVWLVTKPFERGDAVKLKKPQAIMLMGHPTSTNIGAGEPGIFISDGHCINGRHTAVVELIDHPYREWRIVVELSNLESV